MDVWERLRERKSENSGLKHHLNREKEWGGCRSLRGEEMIFGKDEWVLRKIGGRYDSL